MYEYEYRNTRRITFEGGATFIPVCIKCGRYVKHDKFIYENYKGIKDAPNATCTKCGRTKMIFEGYC